MEETTIVALAGILGTLSAPIFAKILGSHYSEKEEMRNIRKNMILKVKRLAEKISKICHESYLLFEDIVKFLEDHANEKNLKDNQVPAPFKHIYEYYKERGVNLGDELLEIEIDACTYQNTRDIHDKIYSSIAKTTDYLLFFSQKLAKGEITEENLKKLGEKKVELEEQLTELRVLKL